MGVRREHKEVWYRNCVVVDAKSISVFVLLRTKECGRAGVDGRDNGSRDGCGGRLSLFLLSSQPPSAGPKSDDSETVWFGS